MYTPYASLTIGTIAGVKSKIGSPSLALQLTSEVTTKYNVQSVNTGASEITLQIAGVEDGDSVQFIGNSLPSPLVTGVTYYAKLVSSTVFQVSATSGGSAIALLTAGALPMQLQDLSGVDNAIQSVLDDTKMNTLAQHLDAHFRDIMPDTMPRWMELRQTWFHNWFRRPNLDTIPVYGMYGGFTENGVGNVWLLTGQTFRPADDIGVTQPPFTWLFIGPPLNGSGTNATLVAIANNGDRAYDTANNILYVNRSTASGTVTWDVQTYEDVKDYLINPSILSNAHNYLACARMFEMGMSRNRVGFMNSDTLAYFENREAYYKNKFLASLYGEGDEFGRRVAPGVLKQLQHDYSDSGIFNEFSREITPEDVWVA